MAYHPSTSSSHQHSIHNSNYNVFPSNNSNWNDQQKNGVNQPNMNNKGFSTNIPAPAPHWENSHVSVPMLNNNFTNPPPSFNVNRPPPPLHNTNIGRPPAHSVNVNRPPPPVNFYQPPPPLGVDNHHSNRQPLPVGVNRPPLPPLPNPPKQYNFPHCQQGCPPDNNHVGFNPVNQSFDQSQAHPPSSVVMQHQPNYTFINDQTYKQQSMLSVNERSQMNDSNQSNDEKNFESEIEKQRKIGEKRLTSWLHKVGKVKKKVCDESKEKPAHIRINDYLCKLQNYMAVISEMSCQVEKMDSMLSDADKSSWQKECDVMETLKTKHRTLQRLIDKRNVEQVEKKLLRTKQRKTRLKKSRHLWFQERQAIEEARQEKEKEISDWQLKLLSEMKEELLKKKRKQEMDQTLSEVTKKIHDANRLIDTMTSLEKLRLIRQDAAKKRGDTDLGESRQSFEQKIADMTRLVQSQLEVYKEEEQQLRKEIKSEQEEKSKNEKELQEIKDKEEQRKNDEDLQKMLFGFSDDANISDPLFPYQQFYKQAETSLPAFVHIRNEWDQYIVPADDPEGSTIPAGWILPSDPTSSTWASALL